MLDGSYPVRMTYDAERQRYMGSMKFQVPPNARVGSDYRVRIASTKYVNVSSFSEYFHVIGDSRGVKGGVFVDSREYMNAQNVQIEENDEDRLFRLLVEQEEQQEKIRAIYKKVMSELLIEVKRRIHAAEMLARKEQKIAAIRASKLTKLQQEQAIRAIEREALNWK